VLALQTLSQYDAVENMVGGEGRARHQVHALIRGLLAEGAGRGVLRDDIAPDELASYCLHALTAASSLPSKAALRRLVAVTLAGLRPPT